jgi:hypothetical protein
VSPWACLPGRRLGPLLGIGFCLGYGHIWKIQTSNGRQKCFARPITLSHDGILTNEFLLVKRGTVEMRIVVSCE